MKAEVYGKGSAGLKRERISLCLLLPLEFCIYNESLNGGPKFTRCQDFFWHPFSLVHY